MDELDQDAVVLAKAIKKQETGDAADAYTKKGGSGEFGAYQFMPSTYTGYAKKYLGNSAAAPSVENQNKIAYSFVKEKKDAGFTPAQIASMWNAGEDDPDAYKGTFSNGKPSQGTNSSGVYYDVPGYVKGVSGYYQTLRGSKPGAPQQPQPAPALPEQPQNLRGATFMANENDTPMAAGLKTLGNIPSSLFNFAKNTIDTLNPINTFNRITQEIPEAFGALAAQQGGAGRATGAALAQVPESLYQSFVPEAGRALLRGDLRTAQSAITEDPVGNIAPAVLGARYGAQRAGYGSQFDSAVTKATDIATAPIKAPLQAVGNAVGSTAKFGAAQATGLKPETLGTIAENPRSFTKEAMDTIDRKTVAEEIKAALDKRDADLDETGAAYGPIRGMTVADDSVAPGTTKTVKMGNGQDLVYELVDAPNALLSLPELRAKYQILKADESVPKELLKATEDLIKAQAESAKVKASVKVDTNWLERALRETTGLGVRDSRLVAKPTSSIREARDVGALQKMYDLWRPAFAKGRLTTEEFLNFRKDLANLAKMDRELTRSGPLENLSGIVRGKFNTAYRKQIPGLEKLDEDFSTQREAYRRLSKGLLDKDGNLTTAGINRVANAVNRGKDLELAKLEEIVPGITQKIRILKAIEDIDDAKGQKVGTYIRGGLAVGGALTLNIPAIIASVLATPELAVPILRQYGFAKPLVDQVVGALKKGGSAVNNLPNQLDRPASDFARMPVRLGNSIQDVTRSMPKTPKKLGQQDVVNKAAELTEKNGGATISLNGDIPTKGYAFAPRKDTEFVVAKDAFNPNVLNDYVTKHYDELSRPDAHIGIWEDDGKIYMDISTVLADEAQAMKAAQASDQLAVFNLETFETKYLDQQNL